MQSFPIRPQYKLILSYDIRPGMAESYYRYILGEMIPTLQKLGVFLETAWHTAYGEHPIRQIDFVAESLETIAETLESDQWKAMEERLKSYTVHYSCKLLEYRNAFQW